MAPHEEADTSRQISLEPDVPSYIRISVSVLLLILIAHALTTVCACAGAAPPPPRLPAGRDDAETNDVGSPPSVVRLPVVIVRW